MSDCHERMSVAQYYLLQAAKLHSTADRLDSRKNNRIFARIARSEANIASKHAATAQRWEVMAATPLDERPGGFPGDPFNSRHKVTRK